MWIDARDALPLKDGHYLAQTVLNTVQGYDYTVKAGWNTQYIGGELYDKSKIADTYIARWYDAETPPSVPEEWTDEFLEEHSKGGE